MILHLGAKVHLKWDYFSTICRFYYHSYSFFQLLCKLNQKYRMNLIIDIGNTSAKLAVFSPEGMKEMVRCSNQSLDVLATLCDRFSIQRCLVSTVITLNDRIRKQLEGLPFPVKMFTHEMPIPIENQYETPHTLGVDRLAAVVEAHSAQPGHPKLVIDAGTCITIDFIDEQGRYKGGNISPGIDMRLDALHTYTSKLPKIGREGEIPPLGKNTETAIRSGVIRGIEHEINGYIQQFQKIYPSLLVFLTGRIEISFETKLKSVIFADSFLVLKGLNRILEYNEAI